MPSIRRVLRDRYETAVSAIRAAVWLSPPAARGVLPRVLDAEAVDWTTVPLD